MPDWGSGKPRVVAELIGALAVLLGLIFVGLELRQNTAAVQASTLQGLVDLSTTYLIDTSLDQDFLSVLSRAQEDLDQLTDIEELQLQRLIRSQWTRYQSAYRHWRRGSLSDEDWEQYLNSICDAPGSIRGSFKPIHERFWHVDQVFLTDDFVAYVESCRPDLAAVAN